MTIDKTANWDEWKGTFLIKHPIKYIFLSHRWPLTKWIRVAGINKNSKILEVGCGGGSVGLYFATRHFNVIFSDSSRAMLEDCRENIRRAKSFFSYLYTATVCQDVFEMAFKDSSFDLVVTDGMYEHFIDVKQRCKAVTEMIRLARNGGSVLISVPNSRHPFLNRWKAKGHNYQRPGSRYREIAINIEYFRKELESFGLRDIVIDGWKIYESIYSYDRSLLKIIGNVVRFFFPSPFRLLRIKFGLSLYALGKVKKGVN